MEIELDALPTKRKKTLQDSVGLEQFLLDWDNQYLQSIENIPLFNSDKTSKWNQEQKEYFVKTFYHVRGHFFDFLWLLGSFAPDKNSKNIVLHNIIEEFGGDDLSHEQLYFKFAHSLGVDLTDEVLEPNYNFSFIKEFNKGHLAWIARYSWRNKMAAFSAYERLDNIDYGSC